MVDPVSRGILGKGKVFYGILVDLVIESKEDAEANMCKESVCWFGKDVIA
jgi:hypothetical protein